MLPAWSTAADPTIDAMPPLPPGFALPVEPDPRALAEPGPPGDEARLDIVDGDRVVHRLDLDPSPGRWAAGLLEVRVGGLDPWRPAGAFGLFPEAHGSGVTAVIAGLPYRFPGFPAGIDEGWVTSAGDAATLSVTSRGIVIERGGVRYRFESAGERWRLAEVGWAGFPDRRAVLGYDGRDRLREVTYPNDEKAVLQYGGDAPGDMLPVEITLPFARTARLKRNDRGYIEEITVSQGSGAGRRELGSFGYDWDADGRLVGFTDERGQRHAIDVEDTPGTRKKPARSTTVIRSEADGSFRFRSTRAAAGKKQGPRVTDGFGEAGMSVAEAVSAYGFAARPPAVGRVTTAGPRRASLGLGALDGSAAKMSAGVRLSFEHGDDAGAGESGQAWAARVFGAGATLEHDDAGRIVRAAGQGKDAPAAAYVYDGRGQLAGVEWGGHTYLLRTDRWGRLHGVVMPNGVSRRWFFDASGHLALVAEAGARPSRDAGATGIDGDGNALFRVPLDAGSKEFPAGTRLTRFERDAPGRVVRIHRPDGGVERFAYDRAGRITQVAGHGSGDLRVLRYDRRHRVTLREDGRGNREQFGYHASGRVAKHRFDPPGRDRWVREYDLRGRLVVETTAALGRVAYEYDERDRVARIVYPDGSDTVQTYDALNRVVTVRGSHQPPVHITYDEQGRPTARPAGTTASAPGRPR